MGLVKKKSGKTEDKFAILNKNILKLAYVVVVGTLMCLSAKSRCHFSLGNLFILTAPLEKEILLSVIQEFYILWGEILYTVLKGKNLIGVATCRRVDKWKYNIQNCMFVMVTICLCMCIYKIESKLIIKMILSYIGGTKWFTYFPIFTVLLYTEYYILNIKYQDLIKTQILEDNTLKLCAAIQIHKHFKLFLK